MGAVFTVLFVLTVSLIVVRVATVGLTLTGVSRDLAQFQSLSAFTGSGFTTKESEDVVNHPVRRRIVMHLMLLGNAGIVIAIASVLRFFVFTTEADDWYESLWFRLGVLLGGISLLWLLASSKYLEAIMWKANTWALTRWTHIDVRDYTSLLRLVGDYAVSELKVHSQDWLAGQKLQDLDLINERVLVLGIEREDGHYIGGPRSTTSIHPGDSLIVYGRQQSLLDLDIRRAGFDGNMEHMIAVSRQLEVTETEMKEEGEPSNGPSSPDE